MRWRVGRISAINADVHYELSDRNYGKVFGQVMQQYPKADVVLVNLVLRTTLEALDAVPRHDTHTPCCAIPAEHKWADPIRCLKDHEDWPCQAAQSVTLADLERRSSDPS